MQFERMVSSFEGVPVKATRKVTDLQRDLKVKTVENTIAKFASSHERQPLQHGNFVVIQLFDNANPVRKLKRTNPFEFKVLGIVFVLCFYLIL